MNLRRRVALLATHPIQYHWPWYQALAQQAELDFKVFYALLPNPQQQGKGFNKAFQWDIPLLEGYAWEALPNIAPRPGLGHFWGTKTRGLVRALRGYDAVILTGWNSYFLWQGLLAARYLNIPCLVRGESNDLRPRAWRTRWVHQALLRQYAAFLVIGAANRRFYQGYGVPPNRLFACPYFVDNHRFAAQHALADPHRAQERARWGIPEDAVCWLYVGKLEPKKRIFDLLAALRQLPTGAAAPIHLLVVGSGALEATARAYVTEYQLPVSFAGFLNQSEMAQAYAAADGLVLPSDTGETWGLVVNEAMSCGLPAVVSDAVGCAEDLVKPGLTGAIFPLADTAQLAQTLAQLSADPVRLAQLGAAARDHIAHYTVTQTLEGTLAALHWVWSKR